MLNSPIANGKAPERLGQELGQNVNFFQVGSVNNKYLVVYKKKKNTSSIFTCLEPIYDLRDPRNQKYITQKSGFMMGNRSSHSWFKKYKVNSIYYCKVQCTHYCAGVLCWSRS